MSSQRRNGADDRADEPYVPHLGLRGGSPSAEERPRSAVYAHPGPPDHLLSRTHDDAAPMPPHMPQFSAPSAMQSSDAAAEYYARHEPLRIHPLPHAYPWPAPYHLPHAAARDPTVEPRDPFLPGMAHAWPPAEQREMGAIGVAWGAQDKSGRSGSAPYAAGAPVLPPHRAPLFAALGPPPTPVSAATPSPQTTPLNSATLPPRKGKPFEISLTKRCNGPNMLRAQYSQVMKEERAEDRCMRLLPSTDRSILCEGCRRYRKLLKARLRRQASGRKLSASRDTRGDDDDSFSDEEQSPPTNESRALRRRR